MSPKVYKSKETPITSVLSALDHDTFAADDTASPFESGLLVYKGILGAMIGYHCTVY